MAGTRNESVKLECQKCSIANTAPLIRRAARKHQKSLQLCPTTAFVASCLICEALGRFSKRYRLPPRKSLGIREADLHLAPHGERMAGQNFIVHMGRQFIFDCADECGP